MKFKKVLVFLLTFILIVLPACSNDKGTTKSNSKKNLEDVSKSGMPIVEEPISIKILASASNSRTVDLNKIRSFEEYKKMTNIDIEWEKAPAATIKEKRNLALASGDLPDAFLENFSPDDILKYGKQGTFIKLNDLIKEYAPNLQKILDEYPEIKKAITFPDGNIYSLPYLVSPEFTSLRSNPTLQYNEEWLNTVGMEVPQTTEDFYSYLKAVKKEYPDKVPYGAPTINTLMAWLEGSFGIGNKGQPYIDIDLQSKEIRFYPISDRYKEMLKYTNKLYSEGLIEQNIYSIEWNQFLSNASEGMYGSTIFYDPVLTIGEKSGKNFISGIPLKGPFGDQELAIANPVMSIGNFVITNTNEHPAATLRWADNFYGAEGLKLLFLGVEGESYEETEDGYKLLDKIIDPPNGNSMEDELAKYAWYLAITARPTIMSEEYFDGAESTAWSLEAVEEMKPYLNEESWPSFTYTLEENKQLSSLAADIEKYVDEMKDKFITGQISFSEWDTYVQQIKEMGLEDYMKIKKAAYKRYESS